MVVLLLEDLSREYRQRQAAAQHDIFGAPQTKECFLVSVRRDMFCQYCACGEEFLGLASFWSTDNQWLESGQPLRHVAQFVAPSTLVVERPPRPRLGLPLPQVYSQLQQSIRLSKLQSRFLHKISGALYYLPGCLDSLFGYLCMSV